MNKIVKNFEENEVAIASDNPKFLDFVGYYLKNFSNSFIGENKTRITSKVLWKDSLCDSFHDAIGENIFKNDKKICYKNNRYYLIAELGDKLDIVVYPRDTSVKNRVKDIIQNVGKRSGYHFYQSLLRNVFHFPLFYILEKGKFRFYHGSACKIKNNILIMPGVAGIGKTLANLCINLIHPDTIMISDNYLLFNKDKLYSFPEPLRLNASFRKNIPSDFEHVFNIRERGYYLKNNMRSDSFSLKNSNIYFIFIVRGIKESFEEIDYFTTKKIIHSTTNYVSHEFHFNSWTAFLPYIDRDITEENSNQSLYYPISSKSFICTVPEFNNFSDAINVYRRFLENVLGKN